MPTIKRKTRKSITKGVKKLVSKHGPEVALNLATTLVGSVVEAAAAGKGQTKSKPKKAAGKKSDKPKKKKTAKKAATAKAKKSSKKAKK